MARVNIEDSLHRDARFDALKMKLGNRNAALGALCYAWILAQKWYLTPEKMIPLSEWKKQFIADEIIEVGLAEIVGDKVRVCGAEEQFKWLNQRSQAGKKGGPAAAKAKAENIKELSRRKTSDHVGSRPLTLSPTPTLTQNSNSKKEYKSCEGVKDPARQDKSQSVLCWEAYREAFVNRYKVEPVRNAKVNGQLSSLVSRLGKDAPEVIKFYFTHNDGLYLKLQHPVGLVLRDAESLHAQWLRGRPITSSDVRAFEKTDAVRSQLERIEKGEL